jgi:ABC-2 type transport system permease protein/oleandomycin transport system permease protein
VLGGAIVAGGVSYVDFLVPGFVVSGLVFTAGGGAVGTAEDAASGLFDRFRSLPIADTAVLTGRVLADAALMVVVAVVTLGAGVVVGFRFHCSFPAVVAALALLVVYAVAIAAVFMLLGLVAGSAQAAQGLGILGVPFSFISSAFVPIDTMPTVLQYVANAQPLTFMINSWRGLLLGDGFAATFDHGLGWYVVGSLVWSVVLLGLALPLALRAYRKE